MGATAAPQTDRRRALYPSRAALFLPSVEATKRLWNAMVDVKTGAIARPTPKHWLHTVVIKSFASSPSLSIVWTRLTGEVAAESKSSAVERNRACRSSVE